MSEEEQKITNEETSEPKPEKAEPEKKIEEKSEEELVFPDEEKPARHFFRSHDKSSEEDRDRLILSTIREDDLMEYLKLEQERLEFLQHAKDVRERRILSAFQLAISLAAVVAIVYFLKDNPTILISILYIIGILIALWVWKNPRDNKNQ